VFSTADTIVAIATPPGRGGLGVVRLSGPGAHEVACRLTGRARGFTPRHATLAIAQAAARHGGDVSGRDTSRPMAPIDQAIVTYFPAPASYTGEDVVEVSVHGGPVVLARVIEAAIEAGARLANRGEFTLRAYLNGRIDLPQAEAVADLIDAVTPLQAQAAFDQLQGTLTRAIGAADEALFDLVARLEASIDFPDEGYHFIEPAALGAAIGEVGARLAALVADGRRGRLVREGLQVAIVGRPNVGKSSLFNALLGAPRAIVTEVAGTTRDLVSDAVDILGVRVTLVDTAGLRDVVDPIEREGVERARGALGVADLALVVLDGSEPLEADDQVVIDRTADRPRLLVANKSDGGRAWQRAGVVEVSAKTGAGLDALRTRILEEAGGDLAADRPAITNIRHLALVERAHAALVRARETALGEGRSRSEEFVLADLQEARAALEEVTGARTPDDVLAHVFARFCVGK
jgi:tRNA modification GTPase